MQVVYNAMQVTNGSLNGNITLESNVFSRAIKWMQRGSIPIDFVPGKHTELFKYLQYPGKLVGSEESLVGPGTVARKRLKCGIFQSRIFCELGRSKSDPSSSVMVSRWGASFEGNLLGHPLLCPAGAPPQQRVLFSVSLH